MRHHLRMGGQEPVRVSVPLEVTRAIDDSPDVARILTQRVRALLPDPAGRAAFLIAHGPNSPEDVALWMRHLRVLADSVRQQSGLRDVRVGIVQDDAAPAVRAEAVLRVREIIELQHAASGQPVAVVPVLIARGALTREKLPNDLKALPIRYDGEALLPHAGMARWIEARVGESDRHPKPGMAGATMLERIKK
jgi:sirohydrochlorin ferrochelatase